MQRYSPTPNSTLNRFRPRMAMDRTTSVLLFFIVIAVIVIAGLSWYILSNKAPSIKKNTCTQAKCLNLYGPNGTQTLMESVYPPTIEVLDEEVDVSEGMCMSCTS